MKIGSGNRHIIIAERLNGALEIAEAFSTSTDCIDLARRWLLTHGTKHAKRYLIASVNFEVCPPSTEVTVNPYTIKKV